MSNYIEESMDNRRRYSYRFYYDSLNKSSKNLIEAFIEIESVVKNQSAFHNLDEDTKDKITEMLMKMFELKFKLELLANQCVQKSGEINNKY